MKIASIKTVYKEFMGDVSEFSFNLAWRRIVPHFPNSTEASVYKDYRSRVQSYLKRELSDTIRNTVSSFDPSECKTAEKRIWVMWWQGGEDTMPEIVRACHRQLKSVCGDYKVVLITKDNYSDYISLSDNILSKVEDGKISLTHLSDIIRCKLLYEHGGLYLDATMYVSDISFLEQYEFYTLRTPGELLNFPSDGNWSVFAMCFSKSHSLLMKCLVECYRYYWERHDIIIDYLMFDYMFKCIFDEVKEVRESIEAVPVSDGYYLLAQSFNEPYSEKAFSDMLAKCPWQKTSYKLEVRPETDGSMTNYGYVISRY